VSWIANSSPTSTSNVGIRVMLPALTPDRIPCEHSWVLALTNIENF
jgi:hypothetical protein